ncbi:RICIN domain-containing protein [Kitasatospora sp. NPDC056138]|uniref:RICIN domain-containing protein n=1 Tax=Kitasatospora sp. NPDC056138 TaxID=3345724 RepID=UPI0035D7EA45
MSFRLRVPAPRSLAVSLTACTFLLGSAISPAHADTSDGGTYTIRNMNSGKCLEVADWSQSWGAQVRQWDCTGGANQKWVKVYDTSGGMYYRNVNSGACLEIAGAHSDYNGAPADQWQCNYGSNQQWLDASSGIIPSMIGYKKCLEIGGWSMDNGAPADIWDCGNNQANQRWTLQRA